MRKLKKAASCLLAASVVLTGFGGTVFRPMNAIAGGAERKYVIWDADPAKVSTSAGVSAKPSGDNYSAYEEESICKKAQGVGTVELENGSPYYSCKINGAWSGQGAALENGFDMFSDNSGGYMGWLQSSEIVNALDEYLQVSYEIYIDCKAELKPVVTVMPMGRGASDPFNQHGVLVRLEDWREGYATNQWISQTQTGFIRLAGRGGDGDPSTESFTAWQSGDILVTADVDPASDGDYPITVKLRKLCIEIRETDKEAINAALKNIDGIDTMKWFTADWSGATIESLPKTADGSIDYFAMLTKYDELSSYSSNIHTITAASAENGSILLSAAKARQGETITITATPADGYAVESVSVSTSGQQVDVTQGESHTYTFVMPDGDVSVSAKFKSATAVPPAFAPAVQVTKRTSDSLTLEWTAAEDSRAGKITYKVYASTTSFNETVSGEPKLSTTETTATIIGLEAETPYYLAITATNEAGGTAVWFSENAVSTTAVNTSTGQLAITADVGVAYTLSIPTSMGSITAAGDHKAGTLYASKLTLGENDKLTVTAAHADQLTHTNSTEKLSYALKSAAHGSEDKADYQSVEFTKDSVTGESGGTDLYVSITEDAWNAAAAGSYTDTVTFTVTYIAAG